MKRFFDKINKTSTCWIWTGAKNNAGYGNFRYNGKYLNSHRVSYLLFKGHIPPKMFVCHTCDNPSCVNPKHLFIGTPQDNDDDKVAKGRQIKGSKHKYSKLKESDIPKIRKDKRSHQSIANTYNVSRRLIGMIKEGTIWKHV